MAFSFSFMISLKSPVMSTCIYVLTVSFLLSFDFIQSYYLPFILIGLLLLAYRSTHIRYVNISSAIFAFFFVLSPFGSSLVSFGENVALSLWMGLFTLLSFDAMLRNHVIELAFRHVKYFLYFGTGLILLNVVFQHSLGVYLAFLDDPLDWVTLIFVRSFPDCQQRYNSTILSVWCTILALVLMGYHLMQPRRYSEKFATAAQYITSICCTSIMTAYTYSALLDPRLVICLKSKFYN